MSIYSRVFNKVRQEGFIKLLQGGVTYLYDLYYDYKFGLDTYSWVSKDKLEVEDSINEHAVKYQATRALSLIRLFKKLKIPDDKVFIDIGSGKGRVLLIAAEFGIKEVRGIEFSPVLCKIAEKNISIYKEKTKSKTAFKIINFDAGEYVFLDDGYVYFMYNPFDEFILKKVLQHISESLVRNKRKILIIYAYPVNRKLIETLMPIQNTKSYKIWGGEFVVYEI